MLFNIYLIPLFDIITNHPLSNIHTYADDMQLNVKCTSDHDYAPRLISACIQNIQLWHSSNSISLNPNKTECIHLHLHPISTFPSLTTMTSLTRNALSILAYSLIAIAILIYRYIDTLVTYSSKCIFTPSPYDLSEIPPHSLLPSL